MKLIVLKPYLLGKSNGGEISLLEYLKYFQSEWGWQIKVVIALPEQLRSWAPQFLDQFGGSFDGKSYQLEGIHCESTFDAKFHPTDLRAQEAMEAFFEKKISEESPDFIWAHFTDFFAVSSAVKWNAERSWVLQTDNEYPRAEALQAFPSVWKSYEHIRHFLVASEFMKKSCEKAYPTVESFLLPRIIEQLNAKPLERDPKYWLFVNPVSVKGVEFVVYLAKRRPQDQFLFVGNWGESKPQDLPENITYLDQQKNLNEVFAAAKALLYPSHWEEAFGRLPLEAMAAGVPVIVSNRGNLPHTVGDGAYVKELDLDVWNNAMDQILKDDAVVQRGFARVEAFKTQTTECLAAYKSRLESKA